MKIYDITLPISPAIAPWPGDTPFDFKFIQAIKDGDACNVGRLVTSVHFGTHADAPFHYNNQGATIDALPLDIFIGPARVIEIPGKDIITTEDLQDVDPTEVRRVLLKTNAITDRSMFPDKIPVLAPDIPAFLGACGVFLLGLDLPSVDQTDCQDMRLHHALGRAGVHILENLDLRAVAPGDYELIALPLRIAGADGSPVRAVLISH